MAGVITTRGAVLKVAAALGRPRTTALNSRILWPLGKSLQHQGCLSAPLIKSPHIWTEHEETKFKIYLISILGQWKSKARNEQIKTRAVQQNPVTRTVTACSQRSGLPARVSVPRFASDYSLMLSKLLEVQ